MKKIVLAAFALFAATASADNVRGDVNGDGEVSIADLNHLIKFFNENKTESCMDVNRDGAYDLQDVKSLLDLLIGKAEAPNPLDFATGTDGTAEEADGEQF